MKKVFALTAVIALVLCMGITAFAADVTTPWDDSNLKISVCESFKNTDGITSGFIGGGNTTVTKDDLNNYVDFSKGSAIFGDAAAAQTWVGIVDSNLKNAAKDAEGFGFYVKNGNDSEVVFTMELVTAEDGNMNNGAYTVGSNKDYALISKDGKKTVVTASQQKHPYNESIICHSNFQIPAGFEGWVCVPVENLQKKYAVDTFVGDDAASKLTGFGWMKANEKANLTFDNLFFYGSKVTEKDADLVLDVPAATADVATIAFAAAALVSCGALTVVKKRK